MAARGRVDELRRDSHPVSGLAHAAFEHVAHTERPRDLADGNRAGLVDEGGIARDDMQVRELGKVRDDVFGYAVGEIFLVRIAAHIGEGEDRD